jgi:hypothetical protein
MADPPFLDTCLTIRKKIYVLVRLKMNRLSNNHDLFYYHQGITNGGAYYLEAIFHVNAYARNPGA